MTELSNILKDRIHTHVTRTAEGAYKVACARAQEVYRKNTRETCDEKRSPKAVACDLESVILTDWRYARLYARDVLEGRFFAFELAVQKAEPTTNPDDQLAIFHYTSNFGEWPEAEKHIINNADLAVRYAEQIMKRPWPDDHPAHDTIASNEAELQKYLRTFPTAMSSCKF
ncbi:hypothetical protein ACQZ44_09480 [Agrobacterium vitis]